MVLAVTAAAFCAGLFVSAAPGIAPDVAASPAEDGGLLVPNIVTIDKFAAMWAPIVATVRRVETRHADGIWDRKLAPAQSWPYCDPACQRGGQGADIPHIEGVTTIERSTASANANAVNRTRKRDRLSEQPLAKQNPDVSPSTETAPASPKRIPLGCDPAFSSAADPARAHIFKRCLA